MMNKTNNNASNEWRRKEKVIINAVDSLSNIQASINTEPLAPNDRIIHQIEDFIQKLQEIQEEGKIPDDMNLFPLPTSLIERIDHTEENNPEIFQYDLLEESLKNAQQLAKKCQYLEDIKNKIQHELDKDFL